MNALDRLLMVVVLLGMSTCYGCALLGNPGEFSPSDVKDLQEFILTRTLEYMDETDLEEVDEAALLSQVSDLRTYIDLSIERDLMVTFVGYEQRAEPVFEAHDFYVLSDEEAAPHLQQRWLRSTQIIRDGWFPKAE